MRKVLFIGFVWPEPKSSAAGIRILQLMRLFTERGYKVKFGSAAKKNQYSFDLSTIGVSECAILLNDNSFDDYIRKIQPDIVVYDRFMIEEQYSWRVREACPNTIHLLDTEDLHFLRYARHKLKKVNVNQVELASFELTQREIASIFRCDLTLIISNFEMKLLIEEFGIPATLLFYIPFLEDIISEKNKSYFIPFEKREHFTFIGNFLHQPNWQAVRLLKERIWPFIHNELPNVQIHVFGAYVSPKVLQLHDESTGFLIKGRAEDAVQTLQKYRGLLAPISFGAGIKGKLLDATKGGTPYITTSVGLEGLTDNENGVQLEEFAEKSVSIYKDKKLWYEYQKISVERFNRKFDKVLFEDAFVNRVHVIRNDINIHRAQNIVGRILNRNQYQSSKYLSLWIEEKNKKYPES